MSSIHYRSPRPCLQNSHHHSEGWRRRDHDLSRAPSATRPVVWQLEYNTYHPVPLLLVSFRIHDSERTKNAAYIFGQSDPMLVKCSTYLASENGIPQFSGNIPLPSPPPHLPTPTPQPLAWVLSRQATLPSLLNRSVIRLALFNITL